MSIHDLVHETAHKELLINSLHIIYFCLFSTFVSYSQGVMNYSHIFAGEFGRVFKGTWTHSSDGGEISEEVAVKTIKSMILLAQLQYKPPLY